jgi:hypothetical protein
VFEDLRRWAILSAQDDVHTLGLIEPPFNCRARLDQESKNPRDHLYNSIIYNTPSTSVLTRARSRPSRHLKRRMTDGEAGLNHLLRRCYDAAVVDQPFDFRRHARM